MGVVAEYDPFHNGHRYHLETAKATVCPDATICIMSGDITQRGELAVLDKWTRAKIALRQGIDLVIELPFLDACSPAGSFAGKAVDTMLMAGAGYITFGCEAKEPEKLIELARLQIDEADKIDEMIGQVMKEGYSHVKARQIASTRLFGQELTDLSLAPNNILALEYLKRIIYWNRQGVDVEPVPILRRGSGYKEVSKGPDVSTESGIEPIGDDPRWVPEEMKHVAGGTAIRVMISRGWDVDKYIPYDLDDVFEEGPLEWVDLAEAHKEIIKQLKGIALRTTPEELSKIRFVGEGIEYKLIKEITEAKDYHDLLKRMTSRRYTTSAIRRMLMNVMVGVEKASDPDAGGQTGGQMISQTGRQMISQTGGQTALYGRILAAGEMGRRIIASEPGLPFIANINKIDELHDDIKRSIATDVRASDLFNLLTGKDMYENSDHRKRPYIRVSGK